MARILPLILLFHFIGASLFAQQDFKVIGYLPYYRFGFAPQIEFDRLTDLNIAFANPDMSGNLDVGGQDILPIVQLGKQNGLRVLISLAGGALTPAWEAAWEHLMLPENRSEFIHKIILYVNQYDLDGVDFDLEWSHVNYKYSPFVLELRDSLTAHDKLLTAALPGTHRYPPITDQALAAFDWINMMAYDLTGSWAPNNPGPHSPYSFAVSSINYWLGQGVPADKLTLGVPFYGYNFSTSPVSSFTYRTMVEQNPANAYVDQVGQSYYNGIPTIQAKTMLAMDQLSGIMIWELGQDSYTELSLLKAIDEVVNGTTNSSEPVAGNFLNVFPNPFGEALQVENTGSETLRVALADMTGRPLQQLELSPGGSQQINTGMLPAGFYVLQALSSVGRQTVKVAKR